MIKILPFGSSGKLYNGFSFVTTWGTWKRQLITDRTKPYPIQNVFLITVFFFIAGKRSIGTERTLKPSKGEVVKPREGSFIHGLIFKLNEVTIDQSKNQQNSLCM